MFAQITFKLAQKLLASRSIFGGLCRVRMDSIEIVASNEQVAGETAAVLQWIARGFCKLERLTLAFAHLRCVDDSSRRRPLGLRARFLSDLFFGCFQRRFHIIHLSFRAKSRNPAEKCWVPQRDVSTSLDMTNNQSS